MRGLVVGFGLSGFWAGMLFLRNLSDKLYIYDDNLENLDQSRVETIKNYAITVGKRVEFVSKFELSFMDDVDLVIVSPGIPPTHSILDLTRNKGIPLVGELEFAFQFLDRSKVNIVGITGTNGKTTTTNLIYQILKNANLKVIGNLKGANLQTGIIAEFVKNPSVFDFGVFEIDEGFAPNLIKELKPNYLLITNFLETSWIDMVKLI